jgi:hypothetical protein
MDTNIISKSWLLYCNNVSKQVPLWYADVNPFEINIIIGLLDYMVVLFLRNPSTVFHNGYIDLHSTILRKSSISSTSFFCQHLCCLWHLITTIQNVTGMKLLCGSNFHFYKCLAMLFFKYLLAICKSSFKKCLFRSISHFNKFLCCY